MKTFLSFSRIGAGAWIAAALIIGLLGMAMNSMVIDSVTFRSPDDTHPVTVRAPYIRRMVEPQEVTVNLFYRGYGNTVLRLTPYLCFQGSIRINGTERAFPENRDQWCRQLVMNLANELHTGMNTLTLSLQHDGPRHPYSPIIGLAIGPPLFGAQAAQSFFTALFIIGLFALLWQCLKRQGYDRITRCIFLAACGLYFHGLYHFQHFTYSLDFEKHAPYVRFLSNHLWALYDYRGPESWHPPLYYWLAALAARATGFLGVFDVWTVIRLLSLISYTAFVYFGMRSIMFLLRGAYAYLALALLVFWPSGFFCSMWIYNDVLLYPLYAACFYYTLVWHETGAPTAFSKALISCGFALMVKTSALIAAIILGMTVLLKLLLKRTTLRDLTVPDTWPGWVMLADGVLFNWGRSLYYLWVKHQEPPQYMGGSGGYYPQLENILGLSISDLLSFPFFREWQDPFLWNLQIRTLLFTNSHWKHPELATCLQGLFLGMLVYVVVFLFTRSRDKYSMWFPVLAGLLLPPAATMAHVLVFHHSASMDGRYIHAVIVAFILYFTLAVRSTRNKALRYGGAGIAVLFSMCAIIFFEAQLW